MSAPMRRTTITYRDLVGDMMNEDHIYVIEETPYNDHCARVYGACMGIITGGLNVIVDIKEEIA
jgi:hypothetical protein